MCHTDEFLFTNIKRHVAYDSVDFSLSLMFVEIIISMRRFYQHYIFNAKTINIFDVVLFVFSSKKCVGAENLMLYGDRTNAEAIFSRPISSSIDRLLVCAQHTSFLCIV